ncbi:S66 family peptidase [Dongshaea marina]|uniref:S66 family peptidase n=1 Tax=Dongshaea marina TaxID=2047966 RepID=UPI000D3E1A38|nr:S66 peptidase family protein [Dongshaea marina]
MTTLYPPPLQPGDGIGFFSPSSPATAFAPKRFARAKQFLQARGFKLIAGQLTSKSDYYRSGSISERAEELNQLIRDPEVRCIISTIGGMNSNSLLPYLDYQALRDDPKIIIGYSDVTALLLGIYAQTGLITFYGPALVASFGEFSPLVEQTFDSFYQILCEPQQLPYRYRAPELWSDEYIDWENQTRAKACYPNNCEFIGAGRVRGRLMGGNLNTLSGIWGSPYMPEIGPGDILFIEDSLKDMATVERSFSMLKLNGVFDRVSAIILGKHEGFDDLGTGCTPLELLGEVLNGQPLPIVNGFDCCHTHPMLTLPIGIEACIDFDSGQLILEQPWLCED